MLHSEPLAPGQAAVPAGLWTWQAPYFVPLWVSWECEATPLCCWAVCAGLGWAELLSCT